MVKGRNSNGNFVTGHRRSDEQLAILRGLDDSVPSRDVLGSFHVREHVHRPARAL